MRELMFQACKCKRNERAKQAHSIYIYHCTFVCEVTGSHLTRAKTFSFSSSLDLDITRSSPLTQPAMALAATKIIGLKTAVGQN